MIFLDLRQITFFPQWMSIRGSPTLDPERYLADIQFPQVEGWEVVATGGEPITENSEITVRDGEVITFHLQQVETESDDEDMDSSAGGNDDGSESESDSDSSGCTFDSSRLPGLDPPPPDDGRPRGPPPPQPMDRSRSPRRNSDNENGEMKGPSFKLHLAEHVPAQVFDITRCVMPLPHSFEELWTLMAPWPPLWMQYSLKGLRLHPATTKAVKEATNWSAIKAWPEEPLNFHLYTDGSAKPEDKHSGYSVVVLLQVGATLALLGLIGEQLVGNPMSGWPLTGVSALEAEHAAIAVALLWALQMRTVTPAIECTIHFDCLTAGYGASGHWQSADGLGAQIRHLDLMARGLQGLEVRYRHVKGHDGDAWNELADAVAKDMSKGGQSAMTPPAAVLQTFMQADLSWAGFGFQAAYDGSVPISQGAVAFNEQPFRPFQLTTDQLIPTIGPPGEDDQGASRCFSLRVCTVNVQGLSGHHKYIEEQLDHMSVNIAFMQETKGHESQCQSNLYYRLETAACRHFGVAIWLHRKLGAWQTNGSPV